jgi:hypothetical protein
MPKRLPPAAFPELELTVEALDGRQGIINRTFHGIPNLSTLLAQFNRHFFQDLWELGENLCGHVAVGRR